MAIDRASRGWGSSCGCRWPLGGSRTLGPIEDAALERIPAGQAGPVLLVDSLFAHIGDVRTHLAEVERVGTDPGGRGDGAY
jgi:hypothetical protein